MENLSVQKCVPCEGGTPALTQMEIDEYLKKVPTWHQVDQKIQKSFKFSAKGEPASGGQDPFMQALAFVNKVGEIAESEGHHPDIKLGWGYVEITLWTHAVEGLSRNDFILASKIDQVKI
ncbi:MAG TPA: 4a-hydroxytetrahydrobiopterin dehydratase [Candidatus Paceibacterota bacterium]